MNAITQTETIAVSSKPVISLKGRGKAQRELAFLQIAPLAYIETLSRADSIANLHAALGVKPSEPELAIARVQWLGGRVAARLPAGERPKGDDESALLEFGLALVTSYAAPPKEGTQARKLRAGQLGRRSLGQQKVVRAAEEAWSQVIAEIGFGGAKTQADKNKGRITRATNANPVRGIGKSATKTGAPEIEALELSSKLKTVEDVCRVVETAAATLLALANKHAKLLPTDYGSAVQVFKTSINAATNARGLRQAAASK